MLEPEKRVGRESQNTSRLILRSRPLREYQDDYRQRKDQAVMRHLYLLPSAVLATMWLLLAWRGSALGPGARPFDKDEPIFKEPDA